jgi:beta-catenin-like protein 1
MIFRLSDIPQAPKLSSGGGKRRLPDNPTPDMLKRLRSEETKTSSQSSNGSSKDIKGKGRAPTVRTEEEEEAMYERGEPFAPGGDADYFVEEDDEGRFFGGGLTDEQKKIMNIFDNAPDADGTQEVGEQASYFK